MRQRTKGIIFGCVAAVIGLMIFGCSGGGSSSSSDKATVVSESSAASKTASSDSANQIYNAGQTVKISNCQLTVTKVEKSNGSDYDKPQKDGDEFVIVSVTIKNVGTSNLSYNPYYFKMKNSQGQITNTTITTINETTALNSGDLAANGSVSGSLTFEEPKGDTGLILQYQDGFSESPKLQFKCS